MKLKINRLNTLLIVIVLIVLFFVVKNFYDNAGIYSESEQLNAFGGNPIIQNSKATEPAADIWTKAFGVELKKNGPITNQKTVAEFNNDNYELLGTITGDPAKSAAVIFEKNSSKKLIKKIGESLDNMKIIIIRRFEAILEDGMKNRISMKCKIQKIKETKSEAIKRPGTALSGIQENFNYQTINNSSQSGAVKNQTINLTRDEINNFLYKELEKVLTTTNVVPYFVDRKMIGIKFNKIAPNSVISRYFGLQVNDVITSINGRPVDSVEKGVKLWDNMKNESHISLNILRDNNNLLFNLNIE